MKFKNYLNERNVSVEYIKQMLKDAFNSNAFKVIKIKENTSDSFVIKVDYNHSNNGGRMFESTALKLVKTVINDLGNEYDFEYYSDACEFEIFKNGEDILYFRPDYY